MKKIGVQERFWTQLGPTWVPKWTPRGTQIGTKNGTKNDQKKHRFWEATQGERTKGGGVNPTYFGATPSRGTVRKVRKATARGPDGIWDSRTVGQKAIRDGREGWTVGQKAI